MTTWLTCKFVAENPQSALSLPLAETLFLTAQGPRCGLWPQGSSKPLSCSSEVSDHLPRMCHLRGLELLPELCPAAPARTAVRSPVQPHSWDAACLAAPEASAPWRSSLGGSERPSAGLPAAAGPPRRAQSRAGARGRATGLALCLRSSPLVSAPGARAKAQLFSAASPGDVRGRTAELVASVNVAEAASDDLRGCERTVLRREQSPVGP